MGKLLIIEGVDGSGKTTQTARLLQRLAADGVEAMQIKFPRYESPASAPVRMYLNGEFGANPGDVNGYAAAAFYAVDRYASYKTLWGAPYRGGAVIVSDRYVTSNMIHQGSKLNPDDARAFFAWTEDFEYARMGLPRPDGVFFLDVPPSLSLRQVERRYHGDERQKDIHEKDAEYLQKCYRTALLACESGYMERIDCVENGALKPVEAISDILYQKACDLIRRDSNGIDIACRRV